MGERRHCRCARRPGPLTVARATGLSPLSTRRSVAAPCVTVTGVCAEGRFQTAASACTAAEFALVLPQPSPAPRRIRPSRRHAGAGIGRRGERGGLSHVGEAFGLRGKDLGVAIVSRLPGVDLFAIAREKFDARPHVLQQRVDDAPVVARQARGDRRHLRHRRVRHLIRAAGEFGGVAFVELAARRRARSAPRRVRAALRQR